MTRQGGTSTHTSFFKGSKIRMIFRDKTVIIAKFIGKLSVKRIRVQLSDGQIKDFNTADLSSCNYYKPLPHELEKMMDKTIGGAVRKLSDG